MRRNLTTLLALLCLLGLGGLAVANNFDLARMLFHGTYLPNVDTLLAPNTKAVLVLLAGIPGALVVVFGLALGLSQVFQFIHRTETSLKAKEVAAKPATPAAKPAAPAAAGAAKPPEAAIPLTSNRSLIVFWVVTGIIIVAFMAIRFYGDLDTIYMPNPTAKLFDIPGQPVKNLPAFIPGPGGTLTAGWAFPAIMLAALVATVAVGFGLRALFLTLDQQIKTADQLPRTWIDRLIVTLDAQVQALLHPQRAAHPGNLFSQVLVALDLLLVLVIVGIIVIGVAPGFGGVRAVDNAVKATQLAALWTPTPLPGPSPTPGPSPDEIAAGLPAGDAANGKALVAAQGCEACHVTQTVVDGKPAPLVGAPWLASMSPDGKGVADHAQERFKAADYKGKAATPQGYLYESITNPGAYIVPGNPAYAPGGVSVMPGVFAQTLTSQNLADIIAYLMTLR